MSRIPNAISTQTDVGTSGSNDLRDVDLNDFLDLLIAELQNQDPLNPMDNSEILQQISQIREIGATNKLSETLDSVLLGQNMTTASSLIGQRVSALSEGNEVEGVVDRVSVAIDPNDDQTRSIRVHVGDYNVDLSNIREIIHSDGT